jgi:hypothetical protein
MKKLLCVMALLAIPAAAFAAPGNGVDVTWNDCVLGTAGTVSTNKNFVCTAGGSNQTYNLIVQFKVNSAWTLANAWTMSFDYINGTGDLGGDVDGFWRYERACPATNQVGLGTIIVPPGSCTDGGYANVSNDGGAGIAGFAWFSNTAPDYSVEPGRGKLNVGYARADGIELTPGVNYYLLHMAFSNRNRTGCPDGCTDPGAIVLNNIMIESGDRPATDIHGTDKLANCGQLNIGGQAACDATPVQNKTWGKLKAMYR